MGFIGDITEIMMRDELLEQIGKLINDKAMLRHERNTLRRALEKAADAQDGCPTPLTERSCPPKTTCQECWIAYYKEEE